MKKMTNKKKEIKSNLDERQEQELLKVEHNGCWFAFWGLLAAIVVQLIIYGPGEIKMMAGEWIVFMVLSAYLTFGSMKNNIWDRKLKADSKTNALISLAAGGIMAVIFTIVKLRDFPDAISGAIGTGVIMGGFVFILTFLTLEICAGKYRSDKKKLEESEDEE